MEGNRMDGWKELSAESFLAVKTGIDERTVLDDLNDRVRLAWQDVVSRPHNGKKRSVTFTMFLESNIDKTSGRNSPLYSSTASTKLPPMSMPKVSATQRGDGRVMVETDEPNQRDMIQDISQRDVE